MVIRLVLIVALTQLALAGASEEPSSSSSPSTPVFAANYHVKGRLSLPYAELTEPFEAWFDQEKGRSRTDYYGDLYKVYQFGAASEPPQGALYKLVWVPASFHADKSHPETRNMFSRAAEALVGHHRRANQTGVRRACFGSPGSVGASVGAQSVLPNLADFSFDSQSACPAQTLEEHRHRRCELWTYSNKVGEKRNVYKMWIRRDPQGEPIPVHYYMLGYDSLLGSHYDRYDVAYADYQPLAAADDDFQLEVAPTECEHMPGPGDEASPGAHRAHLIAQNPIHEFVAEPHRYDHLDHHFDNFVETHNKSYASDHHGRRAWRNFLHNLRLIGSHNRRLKSYKLAVNHFADREPNQLVYLRGRLQSGVPNGGLDYESHHRLRGGSGQANVSALPEQWDWSIRGAVGQVEDQAVCGSCWSFGTSGTLEGAYFVKTGQLPKLSQQQMVDCSWQWGNNGCDGGEDFRAYQYIMAAGGIATEDDYGRYLGVDGKCHDSKVKKTVKIAGFYNVTANSPDALKHALINYGPVTVAIDASRPTFTFYSHGVYYDDKCNRASDQLDHQVLVVGYAVIDGQLSWQVKNSWSTYWGNNGYIMMSAKDNNCGLMDMPTVPIIKV